MSSKSLGRSRAGGGKKRGSSRRKRISGGMVGMIAGGNPLGYSTYGQAGGSDPMSMEGMTGPTDNTFGGSDPVSALKDIMSKGMGAEGLGPIAPPKMGGGGHTRRLRKRSGRARHHRTKSYSAGGKKGRKTRRRHRRRH